MRRFSRAVLAFVATNPNLSVFLFGFAVFEGAIGAWSWKAAGVMGGMILMGIAAWPFLNERHD